MLFYINLLSLLYYYAKKRKFMQTSTFKISVSLVLFFLFTQINIFAQDKSIAIHQSFSTLNSNKSGSHKINYKNTSPFVMLSGYTKDLSRINTVSYRIKTHGKWENWVEFKEPHEGEDYDRFVFDAVFIEKAFEDIQFKSKTPTDSQFVFRLFFPEHTSKLKLKQAATKKMAAGCDQPAFEGRSDWCPSGNCPKQTNPSMIDPDHIVVHHSAANTQSSDYAAVVRSYWDYHVNTHGWADIGYNWLVDPNGVVYEGRGDRVRGAHSPCMNAISTGICFIGNYEGSTQPSDKGMKALKDLIAWDATDKGIDVKASSYVSALGGNMENISGHRDGYDEYPEAGCTSTACPGVNLHNKLQTIRNDVASYTCYIASTNAPKKPSSYAIIRNGKNSVIIKISPIENATKYIIYKSTDHITYLKVTESANTSITIDNLEENKVVYFKIEAANEDGASDQSSALAAIPSAEPSQFLIVDGIERRSFEAIKQYDVPMTQSGKTFSSATNDAVINGLVDLNDYTFVIWMLLDESTKDQTFSKSEQEKVKNYIDNDGVFIVSGNEIGWDLVEKGDATDKSFYENYLKAQYIADNPSPNNYKVKDNDNLIYNLDQSTNILNNLYPDLIKTKNGSVKTFVYDGVSSSTGIAGVSYKTTNGGVEYLAFAIEGITNDSQRTKLLQYLFNRYSSQLSTDDSYIKQNISLYPNPTEGLIKISNPNSLKIGELKIYNIYGQQINCVKNKDNIDLSNFSPGIYLVHIEDEHGKQGSFKILKK